MKFKQRHFIYKNPLFVRKKTAEDTIYWCWFEFLRRSEQYKKVCKSKGKTGESHLKKLYLDFGDIHSMTFREWWTEKNDKFGVYSRGAYLFAEQTDYNVRVIENSDDLFVDDSVLNVQIPLSMSKREISRTLQLLIRKNHKGKVGRRKTAHHYSTALYKVSGRVDHEVIDAFKKSLYVYDEYQLNKKKKTKKLRKKLWEIGNTLEVVTKSQMIDKDDSDLKVNWAVKEKLKDSDKKTYLTSIVYKFHQRSLELINASEQSSFPKLSKIE